MVRKLRLVAVVFGLFLCAGLASGNTVDISKAGAVGDGNTLNTTAIQKAIDTLSIQGGGTLTFPAGRYVTGTIELKDNVTLHLDEQAVILGSTNAADYRLIDPFVAGDGIKLGYALVIAVGAKHIAVEGRGIIDGQGKAVAAGQKPYAVRPFLLRWIGCTDVALKDITLRDPGAWTNQFFQCHNVTVSGLTIRSAASGLRNNDGIDIDSCRKVDISNCDIDSGDDAICIKTTSPQSSGDINIANCRLRTRCNGIKLGTESLGDFENIRTTHCQLRDIGMAGIALYDVDGAHLQNIGLSDITMEGVAVPISIRLGARLKTFREGDHPKPVGTLRAVTIQNVRATGAKQIGLLINGIPGHSVESLALQDIRIELAGGGKSQDANVQLPEKESAYPEMSMFGRVMPAYGVYMRHVQDAICKDVFITVTKPDSRPAAVLVDVNGVAPDDFASDSSSRPSASR